MLFDSAVPGEKGQRALDRLKERFQLTELPPAFATLALAELGIHDLSMNLNRMLRDDQLPERTKLLVGLGVSVAMGSAQAADFFAAAALKAGRTREEVFSAVSLATSMGLYNGYVRFKHQLTRETATAFEAFRPGLNAEAVRASGFSASEKEAICLAVSSANDCSGCVEAHVAEARKAGLTDQQIDEVIKVVATVMPLAKSLSAMTNYGPQPVTQAAK